MQALFLGLLCAKSFDLWHNALPSYLQTAMKELWHLYSNTKYTETLLVREAINTRLANGKYSVHACCCYNSLGIAVLKNTDAAF